MADCFTVKSFFDPRPLALAGVCRFIPALANPRRSKIAVQNFFVAGQTESSRGQLRGPSATVNIACDSIADLKGLSAGAASISARRFGVECTLPQRAFDRDVSCRAAACNALPPALEIYY
jgi:hypothetical protein